MKLSNQISNVQKRVCSDIALNNWLKKAAFHLVYDPFKSANHKIVKQVFPVKVATKRVVPLFRMKHQEPTYATHGDTDGEAGADVQGRCRIHHLGDNGVGNPLDLGTTVSPCSF